MPSCRPQRRGRLLDVDGRPRLSPTSLIRTKANLREELSRAKTSKRKVESHLGDCSRGSEETAFPFSLSPSTSSFSSSLHPPPRLQSSSSPHLHRHLGRSETPFNFAQIPASLFRWYLIEPSLSSQPNRHTRCQSIDLQPPQRLVDTYIIPTSWSLMYVHPTLQIS